MNLNFSYSAEFIKSSKQESDKGIPVTIIPNIPTVDRVNDRMILKAFDKECRDAYLHDGVIDYDHLSVLGESPLIKAQAIIGEPENMYVDEKKKIPICEGILFKGNPYVDQVIAPALRAGSRVFGASVGGKILKKSTETDPVTKAQTNVISKIRLKHIAVCPLQKAVHQGTSISLRKSIEGEDQVHFNDFNDLIKSIQSGEILEKALIAGVETNTPGVVGGQALQQQSLEGAKINKKKIKTALPFVLEGILNGNVSGGYDNYKKYLVRKGFSEKEAIETIKLLAKNGAKIVKLTF